MLKKAIKYFRSAKSNMQTIIIFIKNNTHLN